MEIASYGAGAGAGVNFICAIYCVAINVCFCLHIGMLLILYFVRKFLLYDLSPFVTTVHGGARILLSFVMATRSLLSVIFVDRFRGMCESVQNTNAL